METEGPRLTAVIPEGQGENGGGGKKRLIVAFALYLSPGLPQRLVSLASPPSQPDKLELIKHPPPVARAPGLAGPRWLRSDADRGSA